MSPSGGPSPAAKRWIAILVSGIVSVWGVSVVLLCVPLGVDYASADALSVPEIRDRVVRELVQRTAGTYDSHPDPDIGRILIPGIESAAHGDIAINSNRFGFRERDYELPKPDDVVRVVLLGDSYVFGTNVEVEDRIGAFLEDLLLRGTRAPNRRVEVLNIGILSWNIVAECAYLRRTLSVLDPDLVLQIVVNNDLDDVDGVRGFGGLSRFSVRHRERAGSTVRSANPRLEMGIDEGAANLLTTWHDSFSRDRFRTAAGAIQKLSEALEAQGTRYALVVRWAGHKASTAAAALAEGLDPSDVLVMERGFIDDTSTWVADNDTHWNALGAELLAQAFYRWIIQGAHLSELDLDPDLKLRRRSRSILNAFEPSEPEPAAVQGLGTRVDFSELDVAAGQYVHTGVDGEGLVFPYAALTFQALRGGRLVLRGAALDRPEMNGATVEVAVDGRPVGRLELQAARAFEESFELGSEVGDYLSVTLTCDDWVYVGSDLRSCRSFRLTTVEVVPGD